MKYIKNIIITATIIFAFIGITFTGVFFAMNFNLLNVKGSIDSRNESILPAEVETSFSDTSCLDETANCLWSETREWNVIKGGLEKDRLIIEKVSAETGVSSRLIAAVVVPEQLRFFTAEREVFKRYFEPLKILGSLSKFSLGVSGIKQETAKKIEEYAQNPNSQFYPGESYSALIQYDPGVNQDDELFNRLTNEKDHYFSYLYTAIFIKEILSQWERAGYDISDNPEIVSTIFNIGFSKSIPGPSPKVGGTVITVGGSGYTFGELSGLFYESNQLVGIEW